MSIKLAILGILSWKPSTGYDLKKIIEDSSAMYWSGNNNQIYKTLVQLLGEELVTNEVQHQESSPSKKIYTITEKGRAELKSWVLSPPELPEIKKGFLTQLAWADQLSPAELEELLSGYEQELILQISLEQEKMRRGLFSPNRTSRETYIWKMIDKNIIASYEQELQWVQQLRQGLTEQASEYEQAKERTE
ncbi:MULTISPECIES: PadR family transcriptional regulator [Paenibacillus]|uniref:PadR family transcriptional regulator n=1 Tax=Paenibacillus TaxID=44249 RepID=UPI001FE3D5EF|nr:PadR family transcriptional regulator [Paenibacillus agri]